MNVVLDNADEVNLKTQDRKKLGECWSRTEKRYTYSPMLTYSRRCRHLTGRILLKGDNITLLQNLSEVVPQ